MLEGFQYGVVIQSFTNSNEKCLPLILGDSVFIFEEYEDWYSGCLASDASKRGIFPKAFVKLKRAFLHENGILIFPDEDPFIVETTGVLKEWMTVAKNVYVDNRDRFLSLYALIWDLIKLRRNLIRGTFTAEEMKEVKQQISDKIDQGNAFLHVDAVLRDSNLNPLDVNSITATQVLREFRKSRNRVNSLIYPDPKQGFLEFSQPFCVLISFKSITIEYPYSIKVCANIYDTTISKSISEPFVFNFEKKLTCEEKAAFVDLSLQAKDHRPNLILVVTLTRMDYFMKLKDEKKLRHDIKRPYGLGVYQLSGTLEYSLDKEQSFTLYFIRADEKDSFDSLLKKVIASNTLDFDYFEYAEINFKVTKGSLCDLVTSSPHIFHEGVVVSRRMDFAEIIHPDEIRNDFYIRIAEAKLSRTGNYEFSAVVKDDEGNTIQDALSAGVGCPSCDIYRSICIYKTNHPVWNEIIKISLNGKCDEELRSYHLKILFRNRNEKDKVDKPFGFSFLKLIERVNGNSPSTAIRDGGNTFFIYKFSKKSDASDCNYLCLPHIKDSNYGSTFYPVNEGVSYVWKEELIMDVKIVSTQLTQNSSILWLLSWEPNKSTSALVNVLNEFRSRIEEFGGEVVKFLPSILDKIFEIMTSPSLNEDIIHLAFEALVSIFDLISSSRFEHFRVVLETYIDEKFSATLAYRVILECICDAVLILLHKYPVDIDLSNGKCGTINNRAFDKDTLKTLMLLRNLKYLFKVIVRSRMLLIKWNATSVEENFDYLIERVFNSFSSLMSLECKHVICLQGAALKYLPSVIPSLLESNLLSNDSIGALFANFIGALPANKLQQNRLYILNEIVKSGIISDGGGRHHLLAYIIEELKVVFDSVDNYCLEKLVKDAELDTAVKIFSGLMDILSQNPSKNEEDIFLVACSLLRPSLQTLIFKCEENPQSELPMEMLAVLLTLLKSMSDATYLKYFRRFFTNLDLCDFCNEILLTFTNTIEHPLFAQDNAEIIMLQNSVFLKCLKKIGQRITERLNFPFTADDETFAVWCNFFQCLITFICQPYLQLENLSTYRREKILLSYGDLRVDASFELRNVWFHLCRNKCHFIHLLVGSVLRVAAIPVKDVRNACIRIICDMLYVEYDVHDGSLQQFEDTFVIALDKLVAIEKIGDYEFKDDLCQKLTEFCHAQRFLSRPGSAFVDMIDTLFQRLLEFRTIPADEHNETQIHCMQNVLDLYRRTKRQDMFLKYIYRMYRLHCDMKNFTEAAFTLNLHSELLNWSNSEVPAHLLSEIFPLTRTHFELKKNLYQEIISLFERDQLWENAIRFCKLLETELEKIHDYSSLSSLLKIHARLCDNILHNNRLDPEYYCIGYYGTGFPTFLRNNKYVIRFPAGERLSSVCQALQTRFFQAKILQKQTVDDKLMQSPEQYLQIYKVDPVSDVVLNVDNSVSTNITRYHKFNDVSKFVYSHPFEDSNEKDSPNEFGRLCIENVTIRTAEPLPRLVRWSLVIAEEKVRLTPLQTAIQSLKLKNKDLEETVNVYTKNLDVTDIRPLQLKLLGVLDAAVMGGIKMYQEAFLTEAYLSKHNDEETKASIAELKHTVSEQILLLDKALSVHKSRMTSEFEQLQTRLEGLLDNMKQNFESPVSSKNSSSN